MEPVTQDALAAMAAKETWSVEDHDSLAKELRQTKDAPRRLRQLVADLESANPQPKGGAALKIGIARHMLGQMDRAQAALAEATDNKDRRYFQAQCFKAQQLYDKAIEEFDRAKSRGWEGLEVDVQIVECQALAGNLDAARKVLGKIQDKLSGKADGFYLQGLIEDLTGRHAQAADLYIRARQVDATHPGATFHLAYFYDLHGEEEQALNLYKECLNHPPLFSHVRMNLAVLYEDLGKYAQSARCLESILANNPNHLRARLFLKDIQAAENMYYDEEQAKRVARRNAVLDIPVTDFELSVRARNCLKKMNIRTLGDLVRTSEPELLAYKNFGETSLKEIKDMLNLKGLHLGQATEEGLDAMPVARPASAAAPAPAAAAEGAAGLNVDNLEFSIRSRRALQALGVKTLGDLAAKSEAELMACKNFGQTSLNEIRQRLVEHGLNLRQAE